MAEVCKLLGINKSRTTPYHPQSDGLVERYNRTLLGMLAIAASDNPFSWEDHLRPLCMAYNTSINATTGFSPFYLMFGRQARMPIDVVYGSPNTEASSPEHVSDLRKRLESAYLQVRERMGHKLDRQKDLYNQRVHGKPFQEGDLVWLHSSVIPRGQVKKLHHPWTGPFRVVRCLSEVTYRIQDVRVRRRRLVVHFDRLKLCPEDIRLSQPLPRQSPPTQPPPPPPPGTNVVLLPPTDPPPPPRYPHHQHHAPDYLRY